MEVLSSPARTETERVEAVNPASALAARMRAAMRQVETAATRLAQMPASRSVMVGRLLDEAEEMVGDLEFLSGRLADLVS